MRRRPLLWLTISLICFGAAYYFWKLGDKWAAGKSPRPAPTTESTNSQARAFPLLTRSGNLNAANTLDAALSATNRALRFAYRLANTKATLNELTRIPTAILLENALVDTALPLDMNFPAHLKSGDDPGAWIIQAKGNISEAFRAAIKSSGAEIVSYIPNNAYLVKATRQAAEALRAEAQSVLAYEPYYKLKSELLRTAAQMRNLPENARLNVLLFPGDTETVDTLGKSGAQILGETRSPFGRVVTIVPRADGLPEIARLPGVQVIEPARERIPANDLSRVSMGVATNSTTTASYLGLSGTNVLVNVNDTGIDATHPDLTGRVAFDAPISGVDSNGHGTHVAGTIASSGGMSSTVTGAIGSVTNAQFRGVAPGAKLFSQLFSSPDVYLQESAARTNALISNNSWQYRSAFEYDLAAASYDAAARDALPTEVGSQPLLFVFAAGNSGNGGSEGSSGQPDSIVSPGTAKNVITVGAVEQFREITNRVRDCVEFEGEQFCTTNQPWIGETDSATEVAGFSSRGNVGVSAEGEQGRFKPDVVAPGTMVVSTRSGQWDTNAYYSNTNYITQSFSDTVAPGGLWPKFLFLPVNAVGAKIEVMPNDNSPQPFPPMPIYLSSTRVPTNTPGGYDVVATNELVLPRDYPLAPLGQDWIYSIGNNTSNFVAFTVITTVAVTNSSDYNEVLKGMNDALGPYYRYESGSSMAAAQVSGALALMHEFFLTRLSLSNSPALMKALLINGARNLNPELYDFQVGGALNSQGWGMVNLTNSLPGAIAPSTPGGRAPLLYFDQSPTNALATGASRTFTVNVDTNANFRAMRVTLVWTDPPGNPAASLKLVNDLDLIVTNLDSGKVYFGNDIRKDDDFTSVWDTNTAPVYDNVNNVENVFLPPKLGTNYSITVLGRRVNVNAVTAHTNDVVQDYALVVSCGEGTVSNALALGLSTTVFNPAPEVTTVTNAFEGNPDYSGNVLYGQRAGASTPLLGTNQIAAPIADGVITLGMTNQWHFYAISNIFGFTNAAFMTFLPPNLAVPRMGATVLDPENAARTEADIDMYVSTDPGLTNLDPASVSASIKALGRNGSETIILSNAIPAMYYVGVKAEDQQAAEYAFAGVFSRFPFSEEDALGNQTVYGFPVPQEIPDAYVNTAGKIIPGLARVLAFSVGPELVRRVIVTNSMKHQLIGDLIGVLSHGREAAILNNHTTNSPAPIAFDFYDPPRWNSERWPAYIYDDSEEMNVPFAIQSDGPGTLMNFGGREGAGQWIFTQADGAVTHLGTNGPLVMFLEKQQDLEDGIVATIEPGACRTDYVRVPAEATNLTIEVSILSGAGPVSVGVCPLENLAGCESTLITNGIGGSVTIDILDDPPLEQGVYSVRTCNLGTDRVTVRIVARIYRGSLVRESLSSSSGPVTLNDDAITYAYITNLTDMRISSMNVGLLFNHPRISDMAITLVSPNGTRVLLFEDRGGLSSGMGNVVATTNGLGEVTFYYFLMKPFFTTSFDSAPIGRFAAGVGFEGWSVLTNYVSILQDWSVPWQSNNILSLEDGAVHFDLPTTNLGQYALSWKASHAPYFNGTVGWWPFEGDGRDIFGGFDSILLGGGNRTNYSMFAAGKVNAAFFGDAVRTSARVPAAPELDVAGSGFTVEGWIYPVPKATNLVEEGTLVLEESFESFPSNTVFSVTNVAGWDLTAGTIDVLSTNFGESAHTGTQYIDINGSSPGSISTNIVLNPNQPYRLTLAYTRHPDGVPLNDLPEAAVEIGAIPLMTLQPTWSNSWASLGWVTTSMVFTVTAPTNTFTLRGLNPSARGVFLDSIQIEADSPIPDTAPLVEWVERENSDSGLKFWVSGLAFDAPQPGALVAAYGTNDTQSIATQPNLVRGRRWQHVALSYDAVSRLSKIYLNGQAVAAQAAPVGADPVTTGDLFFGFHPANATNVASFKGGLDEFGLYRRPLTDCEINAIFQAGALGKHGTNALTCPVAYELTVKTDTTSVYTFTNGLSWAGGPSWETTSIAFTNPVLSAITNGPGTNLAGITIRPLTPNVALDEFVLSALTSNRISGAMQFTENTNLALLPIKFAPTPYSISNFPPIFVFSNNFISALPGPYTNGAVLPGAAPLIGRDWLVTTGSVTVVSNHMLNPSATNSLALGEAAIETTLPTRPGRRYELTYTLRGPGAVGWWNGDLEPLSGRALDLIGGNHGAFVNGATNHEAGFILQPNEADTSLYFPSGEYDPTNPYPTVAYSPRVELSDPPNLRLTNALTIEGWIYPRNTQTNFTVGVGTAWQQIFYRGDGRDCLDPYYLAVYYSESAKRYDVVFHVEDASGANCGFDLFTTDQPVRPDQWQHVAAVFEANVPVPDAGAGTNSVVSLTNQLSIYLEGELVARKFTSIQPFADLDPSFTPGVAIGNRSRYSRLTEAFTDAEPFYGDIDDLAVYGRALTDTEVKGIADRSLFGKGDLTVPPNLALAKVQVLVDGVQMETANGENDRFTTRTLSFTAIRTNAALKLQGLLPGTIIEQVSLTEVPSALNYLPEESLNALTGENSFGVWTLEMWDTRAGGAVTNGVIQLVDWRLDFQLMPTNPQPVITLQHGVPHENVLLGHEAQHFVVPVPLWATNATNVLLWSTNHMTAAPGQVGVLFDGTNQAPSDPALALFWPPVFSGINVLTTNSAAAPFIVPGRSYYLTVTNPSAGPMSFSYGVWFDIPTLTNCQPVIALANPAGVPCYFQFDVPEDGTNSHPREVTVSVTGALSNLTLVVGQNLPLPSLSDYDYISRQPSTNDQFVMVLTNNTPYPIEQGKWYAGVYNSQWTNVPFTIQVCYSDAPTNSPRIIPLTNNVPFVAPPGSEFAAPPGPPRWLFYEFNLTNPSDAMLFELYGLSGDADLILQREVPSGMAPYYDGSFRLGRDPEAVVVRANQELGDLRGKWYLGVYNNELTNVSYTVRVTTPGGSGLLNSALPILLKLTQAAGPHGVVLEWNSIPGEVYIVEFSPTMIPVNWQPFPMAQPIRATTPVSAVELPIGTTGRSFYRIQQVPRSTVLIPPMTIQKMPDGTLRVSWPSAFQGLVVQSTSRLAGGPWINANAQIIQEGSEFAFYVTPGPGQRFFRLIAQ